MSGDGTPTWATEARPRRLAPAASAPGGRPPPPITLVLAAAAVTVLAVAEAAHVAGREELVPGFRIGLGLVVALQVVLAAFVVRRSSGAALGLFLCQATTVVAALGGGFGDDRRLAYAGGALLVAVLLGASLHAFPAPRLPPIDPGASP